MFHSENPVHSDTDLSQSSCGENASFLSTNSAVSRKSVKSAHGAHSEDSDSDAGPSTSTTSRKEKSLGKLCRRFLIAMGESLLNVAQKRCQGGPEDCSCAAGNCSEEDKSCRCREIHLESVAKHMATEKRRIYDIVNVMEALDAMSKGNKSFYQWNTLAALPVMMAKLQKDAEAVGLKRRVEEVQKAMFSLNEVGKRPQNELNTTPIFGEDSLSESPIDNLRNSGNLKEKNNKNSLALLCSRFLMVLLCDRENRRASLDVASTVLIKETEKEGFEPPSRSRCRRLYDIANVLVALGLVRKEHYHFGTKRIPIFVYQGPELTENVNLARESMKEFITRSNLAQQHDPTWVAIFGASKWQKATSGPVSDLSKSNLLPPLPSFAQKPQRKVLGELSLEPNTSFDTSFDKSRKRSFGQNNFTSMNSLLNSTAQYKLKPVTRKESSEDKENIPPTSTGTFKFELDENSENVAPTLLKPEPRMADSPSISNKNSTYQSDEPPLKRSAPSNQENQPPSTLTNFPLNFQSLYSLNLQLMQSNQVAYQIFATEMLRQQSYLQQQHQVSSLFMGSGSPKAFKPPHSLNSSNSSAPNNFFGTNR